MPWSPLADLRAHRTKNWIFFPPAHVLYASMHIMIRLVVICFWLLFLSLRLSYTRAREDAHVLYATNAIAIDECTLHILDASSGKEVKAIGTVEHVLDDTPMGIFGMCFFNGSMYAVNHLDQLVTIDLQTAKATMVGSIGVNGLYDLACPPASLSDEKASALLYSYGAQDSKLVAIDPTTGQGRLLASSLPPAEAVSMDFDHQGTLWLLANGKALSVVDTRTGALTPHGTLDGVHVNQRHGSIKGGELYSAFFEATPSNVWKVHLVNASVESVLSTNLDNTYTLAFVNATMARL
ncbi:hypothetical protein MPSEU_000701300 [Mayamaea pseudoterrestris]|nr:hypothetical protein MPSEU_000701300 [Mayamaea pseudoterrestris]